jgi:hypothetical protein
LPIRYRAGETPEGVSAVHLTAPAKRELRLLRSTPKLDPIIRDWARMFPQGIRPKWLVELIPFSETFPGGIRRILSVMFAAVVCYC